MISQDVLKKVRKIEITTNRMVNDILAGEYHSVFKGRGMEFSEVREYQAGDDIRSIDWNVTARMGAPFVKKFVEERELTVMLLVDASGSQDFGTDEKTKLETVAEICACLAFSAIKNNDRVGLIIFTDIIEKYIPPKKGRKHVLRVIRELLTIEDLKAQNRPSDYLETEDSLPREIFRSKRFLYLTLICTLGSVLSLLTFPLAAIGFVIAFVLGVFVLWLKIHVEHAETNKHLKISKEFHRNLNANGVPKTVIQKLRAIQADDLTNKSKLEYEAKQLLTAEEFNRNKKKILSSAEDTTTRSKTDISVALEYLNRIQKRKCVSFLVSDFLSKGYEKTMRIASQKHDVITIPISDPREVEIPKVGFIEFQDAETGEIILVDTNDSRVRRLFTGASGEENTERDRFFKSNNIDTIPIQTSESYVEPLVQFFKRRMSKFR